MTSVSDFVVDYIENTCEIKPGNMFREYVVHADRKNFVMICDNTLFVMPTAKR